MILLALSLWPIKKPTSVAKQNTNDSKPRESQHNGLHETIERPMNLGPDGHTEVVTRVSKYKVNSLEQPTEVTFKLRRLKRMMLVLVSIFLSIIVIVSVGEGIRNANKIDTSLSSGSVIMVDSSAPYFKVTTLKNLAHSISLTQFQGSFVVINFWASWCVPCRQEMPALESASEYLGNKIVFIGIDTNDSRSQAIEFANQVGVKYILLFDPNGEVATNYGILGLPTTIFISRCGQEVAKHLGALTSSGVTQVVKTLNVKC